MPITFKQYASQVGLNAQDLEDEDRKQRVMAGYNNMLALAAEDDEEEEDMSAMDDPPPKKEDEEETVPAEDGPPPPPPNKKDEEEEEEVTAQRFDVDAIRAAADNHLDDLEVIYASVEDVDGLDRKSFRKMQLDAKQRTRALKQEAINKRWSPAVIAAKLETEMAKIEAKCELEKERASRPKGPAIHASNGGAMNMDVLAAAVMSAGRYEQKALSYDHQGRETRKTTERLEDIFAAKTLEAADKRFRRGIGLQEVLIEAAQMNGWTGRSWKQAPQECMRAAFGPPIHAAFSTSDIAGLLSNVANKFLLEGFWFVEQVWKEISDIQPVNDFKTKTAYRLTGAEEFKMVPAGGEIKHGTLTEESFTNKADTYGLMLSVTRTDIINDDLGAITTIPRKLGRGAGKAMNKVFWTEFLGQLSTTFTAARANYFSGSSTNLSISSLTTAEQMFMDLTDPEGDPIGHSPTMLLGSTSLSATSAALFNSTELRNTTASTEYPVNNPHAGKFRPVISRYIGNSAFTGYTTTGWGLLADPKDVPVIEMCFLNGNESPTIEQAGIDANFSTLGIQMRAFLDFGCNIQDYRGGVWSKGAS